MKKHHYFIASILILCIAVIWIFCRHSKTELVWEPVKQGPVITAIYGLGKVTSGKVFHLKVGVSTHVKKVYVREGDDVKAGQPLIELSGMPIYTANFDGTITNVNLHENENVAPQTVLLTLMDLKNRLILVSLEQEAAIRIHKGLPVKINFSGLPDQTFDGTVMSVYPKDQESYVKIAVNNLPETILPEMSSDVAIILDKKENALLIPMQAVKDSTVTIRHSDGKIQKMPIKVGTINENYAEIISNNLKLDDQVLVKV